MDRYVDLDLVICPIHVNQLEEIDHLLHSCEATLQKLKSNSPNMGYYSGYYESCYNVM